MTSEPAGLPEGWRLDPDVHQELGETIGAWWVITDTGQRTAWQDPANGSNASVLICPICQGNPAKTPTCDPCSGRGLVTTSPTATGPGTG